MNKALRDYMRKIGKRGGLARNKNLSPERIREIAVNAGKAKGKKNVEAIETRVSPDMEQRTDDV